MKSSLSRNIPLYYATEFFTEAVFMIPVWVAFQRQYISFAEMSMVAAMRYAVTLILELPTGAFADMLGRKSSIAIGYALQVIGLIIFALSSNAPMIFIAVFIRAIGESFQSGAHIAIIYDTLKELKREKEFPHVRSTGVMWSQYALVGAPIIGGLLSNISLRVPFIASATSFLCAFVMALLMKEPNIDSEKFTLSSYLKQTRDGFAELWATSYSKMLSVFYAAIGGITWSWQVFFNITYLSTLGFNEASQGVIYGSVRLFNAILVGLVFKKLKPSRKYSFLLIPILSIIVSIIAPFTTGWLGILVLSPLHLPSTLRFIFLDHDVNQIFSSKNRATALSSLNMLLGIIFTVFILIGGYMLDIWGIGIVYSMSGIALLAVVLPIGFVLYKLSKRSIYTSTIG